MQRVAVLVGASSGLGQALAQTLAADGYHIALLARDPHSVSALLEQLQLDYPQGRFISLGFDLNGLIQSNTGFSRQLSHIEQQIGNISAFWCCAAQIVEAPIGQGLWAEQRDLLQVNVLGLFALIDAAAGYLKDKPYACQLAVVSSISAQIGMPKDGAYCASKAALDIYLQALQLELPADASLKVCVLAPGYIHSEDKDLAHKPFVISAQQAAQKMLTAVKQGRAFSFIPAWPWRLLPMLAPLLPKVLLRRIGD